MMIAALDVGCDAVRSDSAKAEPTAVDGKPFDLWHHVDKSLATVLIFTRTDCPISNRYAPSVASLCNTYQPRGVDFLLVYVNPRENPETNRKHLAEYQYPCRGVLDP